MANSRESFLGQTGFVPGEEGVYRMREALYTPISEDPRALLEQLSIAASIQGVETLRLERSDGSVVEFTRPDFEKLREAQKSVALKFFKKEL